MLRKTNFCQRSTKIPAFRLELVHKKGILEIAKNINAGKYEKEKAFIKKIVLEHFDCKDCKKFGMFEDCHYVQEKTCQRILSDWCNNVIGW